MLTSVYQTHAGTVSAGDDGGSEEGVGAPAAVEHIRVKKDFDIEWDNGLRGRDARS